MVIIPNKFLCVFFLTLHLFTEALETPTVDQLETELAETEKVIDDLKAGNENLNQNITLASGICSETISNLQNDLDVLLEKINKIEPILKELLKKIQDEELIHQELERILKALYTDLDIFGLLYEIVYQDLVILENRRGNGTNVRCENLVKDLEELGISSNLSLRSFNYRQNKLSKNSMDIIILKNKLNLAKLEKSKLQSQNEELIMQRDNEKELCNLKESDFHKHLNYTANVSVQSEKSVEKLKGDLEESVKLTETLNNEIDVGRKLLATVKENISKFQKMKEAFDQDEKCYKSIEEASL